MRQSFTALLPLPATLQLCGPEVEEKETRIKDVLKSGLGDLFHQCRGGEIFPIGVARIGALAPFLDPATYKKNVEYPSHDMLCDSIVDQIYIYIYSIYIYM